MNARYTPLTVNIELERPDVQSVLLRPVRAQLTSHHLEFRRHLVSRIDERRQQGFSIGQERLEVVDIGFVSPDPRLVLFPLNKLEHPIEVSPIEGFSCIGPGATPAFTEGTCRSSRRAHRTNHGVATSISISFDRSRTVRHASRRSSTRSPT